MKVLIFSHTFPRYEGDNVAPFMGNLASSLFKKLKDLVVLIPYDAKIKNNRGYKIRTFRYILFDNLHLLGYSRTLENDKKLKWYVYLLSPLYIVFGTIALIRLIKSERLDLISAHWIIPNGFITYLATRIYRIPYTVTIPGSDVYLSGKNKAFYFMTKLAAENAETVISDNLRYMKQLEELGIKSKKTQIINYGVNTESFKVRNKDSQLMIKYKLSDKNFIVLGVGRLVQKKGFVYLINAAGKIKDRIKNFKLIIVGDGDQKEFLKRESDKNKLDNDVIFTGMIGYDDLSKFYNLADVFVMPSIKDDTGNIDASPVALMEAMLSGLMVVTTDGTVDKSLSKSNKYLRFVKERNSEQIYKALTDLFRLSKLNTDKLKIKKQVRESAIDQFSSDSVASRYIKLFKESLD